MTVSRALSRATSCSPTPVPIFTPPDPRPARTDPLPEEDSKQAYYFRVMQITRASNGYLAQARHEFLLIHADIFRRFIASGGFSRTPPPSPSTRPPSSSLPRSWLPLHRTQVPAHHGREAELCRWKPRPAVHLQAGTFDLDSTQIIDCGYIFFNFNRIAPWPSALTPSNPSPSSNTANPATPPAATSSRPPMPSSPQASSTRAP